MRWSRKNSRRKVPPQQEARNRVGRVSRGAPTTVQPTNGEKIREVELPGRPGRGLELLYSSGAFTGMFVMFSSERSRGHMEI